MIRQLGLAARALWWLGSGAGAFWAMSQNPLALPLAERGLAEARAALHQAMAETVTADWLLPRIDAALAAGDRQRLGLYADLAEDHAIALPDDLRAAMDAALRPGLLGTLSDCGTCMADMVRCPDIRLIAVCTLPFELSPAGDASALGRQGLAWWRGDDPDEIEAALAGIGLAATAAALFSAGSTLGVKGAATSLRVARRAKVLTPGLSRAMLDAARGADGGQALGRMVADVGRIGNATSNAEMLLILRHADNPVELGRIARFTEVAGPRSRHGLEALGKARSLRLLTRISDLALAVLSLMGLMLGMVASALGWLLSRLIGRLLRPARPRTQPSARARWR